MTAAAATAATPAATGYAALLKPTVDRAAQEKNAGQDFEGVFLSQMFSHMFEGLDADPVFGGGAGENMFRGMMVQEFGKQMAKTQSIGLSDQMQKTLLHHQQH